MNSQGYQVRRRRATLGLDYGTHSTKAVYRVRNEQIGQVLCFNEQTSEYPNNAVPSAIREVDGKLFFGKSALQMSGGQLNGSLKVDLFKAADLSEDERLDVLVRVASYLGWALSRLRELYPEIKDDTVVIQISAPTSHAGPSELSHRYNTIANAIYAAVIEQSQFVKQGFPLEDAYRLFAPLLKQPLPDAGERLFFVMPETVAPVVSLQQEPYLNPGNYLIADMGASTTEMSLFFVRDKEESVFDRNVLCYVDSTQFRGGIELAEIRLLPINEQQSLFARFQKLVEEQACEVWARGYEIDRRSRATHERWKRLQILLTGGGTLDPIVAEHFLHEIYPFYPWPMNETKKDVARHSPSTLSCERCKEADVSLFAVANGLAIERNKWPRFYDDPPVMLGQDSQDDDSPPSYLQIG